LTLYDYKYRRRLASIIVAGLLFTACARTDQDELPKNTGETEPAAVAEPFDSVVIGLEGVDSSSVFEILCSTHHVDYLTTAAGVFVRAIDSLENNDNFFWIYSVNDTMPQVASDKYLTSEGDSVRWHYRRVEP